MNRLNNVSLIEVKELKIEQPPIIPDEELALQNRKTIAEIKQIEGNLEELHVSMFSTGKEECIEESFEHLLVFFCLTIKGVFFFLFRTGSFKLYNWSIL